MLSEKNKSVKEKLSEEEVCNSQEVCSKEKDVAKDVPENISDSEGFSEKKEKKSCKKKKKKSESEVEKLQKQLNAEKDRVLRLSAEFDNYKKRSSREIADFRKFANESVFKKLLTIVDNLERAIESGKNEADKKSILEGVKMTHKEMIKLFEIFNVKSVEAQGKPFDPVFHQAVTNQESDEYPNNTVISELQKGYLLHDRLIRPSMVVVSKTVEKQEQQENQEQEE